MRGYIGLCLVVGATTFLGVACVSCAGQKAPPQGEAVVRTVLDIIELVCQPEITVGDCHNRVRAWLPGRDGG